MNSVEDVLESVVKYGSGINLASYLKSCDETRVFSNDNADTSGVIALTNRLLNENSSRRAGLLVLKCLLGQLPREIIHTHLLLWIQQAVKGLSQKESHSIVVVAADVTCTLLRLSTNFSECKKEISLSTIGKVYETLYDLKGSEEFLATVLSSLTSVLQYYNKSGASWKAKFERFVITLIETSEETVSLAARCYLALGAWGPPGTDHINYKENWVSQFKSLSTSLHLILDKLFDNVNEIEQFSRGRVKWKLEFELPTVNEKVTYLKMSRLTQQFSGLCQFLEVMLLGHYPVAKTVTPELLLSVACRGLAVTSQTLKAHETSDSPSLAAVLPVLHSCCVRMITALIKSCRLNLITYGPMICKLITQVLKSTETQKLMYGQNKPYRSVRIHGYECLSCWLSVAKCSSNVEKHPELVAHIISDIHFKKPSVTLNLASKVLKGKLGKKQRRALVNQTMNNRDEYIADREANKDVCCAALGVIPVLLESASSLLTPQVHKDLQTAIMSELLITQLSPVEHVPPPYSDKSCRLGLYKSFMATCLNFHPSFPPPLSFASHLITSGLQDPIQEIVQFCILSSSALEKMLRPIGPTLSFPVELPDAFSSMVKLISSQFNGKISNVPNVVDDERPITNEGGDLSAADSPNEPELNPLLVDPDMSEFDFLSSSKDLVVSNEGIDSTKVTEEPLDEQIELTGDESQNEPLKESCLDEHDREVELQDTDVDHGFVERIPEPALKRKPSPEPTQESPTSKKSKPSSTDNCFNNGSVEEEAVTPVDTVTEESSLIRTVEKKTDDFLTPANELEAEMLSSFVDVID